MSYGNSKKWIAPGVREKQRHDKLNQARSKICKDSPFWHANFDIDNHKREFNALLQARFQPSTNDSTPTSPQTPSSTQQTESSTTTTSPSTSIRSAFSGKTHLGPTFTSNLSPVLGLPTVFTPHFKLGKPFVAPWPSKSEMKYEGDDRIATDKLHGRFPGAPRVEGNETVNWQHRNIIPQYDFENYHGIPCEAAVLELDLQIDEMVITYDDVDEAVHLLGKDLYEMLDPVDRL